jgi:hypothetical protein
MSDDALTCPSGQADQADAEVLGVVTATPEGPRVACVAGRVPVTANLLASTGELPPNRVIRFASRCIESQCMHFDGTDCRLAQRIVKGLDPVVDGLPPCAIRRTCRWFAQEGAAACLRCPQVVTVTTKHEPALVEVALPG